MNSPPELTNEDRALWRDLFRRASSYIPSAVAIVAAVAPEQGVFGFTVSSLTPVSVEPPLVSICVDATSPRLVQLQQIGRFSVNLLGRHQAALARSFGSPGTDRFSGIGWHSTEFGCPVLDDMAVVLLCEFCRKIEAGDHEIILAEVNRLVINGGEPLVYWRRGFHDLTPAYPFLEDEAVLDQFIREWEAGVLPSANWTHAAHVGVAAYYAFSHPPEVAFQMTKAGILHYNVCVGTRNTDDSGYHETLTRFWSEVVGGFVRGLSSTSRLETVRQAVRMFGQDRDLHRLYYSFDVVRDRRARREWVTADRVPPVSLPIPRLGTD